MSHVLSGRAITQDISDWGEHLARAAIAAMREPTEAMVEAAVPKATLTITMMGGGGSGSGGSAVPETATTEKPFLAVDPRRIWQAMIDATE